MTFYWQAGGWPLTEKHSCLFCRSYSLHRKKLLLLILVKGNHVHEQAAQQRLQYVLPEYQKGKFIRKSHVCIQKLATSGLAENYSRNVSDYKLIIFFHCRCVGNGFTYRWYHLSFGEHICNMCFEWAYRR